MVRTNTRVVGAGAENLAYGYLKQNGLIPIRRNFQCRLGELDLIMRDERCLVIIEVRYRGCGSIVPARLTIDARKQSKIIRTTALFLAWNEQFANWPVRFDVLGINARANGDANIEWIKDAFRPRNSNL